MVLVIVVRIRYTMYHAFIRTNALRLKVINTELNTHGEKIYLVALTKIDVDKERGRRLETSDAPTRNKQKGNRRLM